MGAKLGLMQQDNLLALLNEVESASEFACAIGLDEDPGALKLGAAILGTRAEIGAFLDMDDAGAIVNWESEAGAVLIAASTSPFFSPRPTVGPDAMVFATVSLATGFLLPGGILFAIKWQPIPTAWNQRGLVHFLIGLAGKRLGLSQRHARAERSLKSRQAILDALNNQTPAADEASIAAATAGVTSGQTELANLNREVDQLNKLVKEKKLKEVWAIVKRNLERGVTALKRELRGVEAEDPVDKKRKKKLEDDITDAEGEIATIEAEVAAVE